ncbi:MAG: Mur ligase family protein, partial [Bacteroidota bacterium]
THGIVTNVGKEHLEYFHTIENIAKEETTIFTGSVYGFVNSDDEHIVSHSVKLEKKITYGFDGSAVVSGRIRNYSDGGCAIIEIPKFAMNITLQIPGKHNAYNALAAVTIGNHFGIHSKNIQDALENFTAYNKRSQTERIGFITVINDTYNANPDSAISALQTLQQFKTEGKKIIVFGDMLELGTSSADEHSLIGKKIAEMNFEYLFGYGTYSKETIHAARIVYAEHFSSKKELSEQLISMISPNDVVLIKGSRGMRMEEIVEELRTYFKH